MRSASRVLLHTEGYKKAPRAAWGPTLAGVGAREFANLAREELEIEVTDSTPRAHGQP